MDREKLIDKFFDAWNDRDLEKMMECLDRHASYYDAMWMEYAASHHLREYLQNTLGEELNHYVRQGESIPVEDDNIVMVRYKAYGPGGCGDDSWLYDGAESLSFRGDKIVAVTDFYCNPNTDVLQEVGRLATRHHGEVRHVPLGLSALKAYRYRQVLMDCMDEQRVYLDSTLTQSQLASMVGCSVYQLDRVIDNEFHMDFITFLDHFRVRHAKQLLRKDSVDMEEVACASGYSTLDDFNRSFQRMSRESPAGFHAYHKRSADND